MHGVGYLSPMKSAGLDLRTRQLDWCNELEFLHSIERQWLEDKVARESKIIRKVEGADKLEKTGYQSAGSLSEVIGLADVGRVGERGSWKREENWTQAFEPSEWGQVSPTLTMTILLNALLYGRTGNLKMTFLWCPCWWSFSLEASRCRCGQVREHRQTADIWADMRRSPGILLQIAHRSCSGLKSSAAVCGIHWLPTVASLTFALQDFPETA